MRPSGPAEIEHDHLSREETLECLGATESAEERRPLFHLLATCPTCREAASPLLELYRERRVLLDTSFGEVQIAMEEHEAPELWRRMEADALEDAVDREEVLRRVRGDARWPTWGLVAWHARRSTEAARSDPEEAFRWAKMATAGAARLRADGATPEEWIAELRAFAHAALGNAYRVAGDLRKARVAFARAHEHLDAYPLEVADYLPFRPEVFEMESSLHRARRDYRAAFELLDRAYAAWALVDRALPEDRARVLLKKAKLLDEIDDLEGALAVQEEAANLLGPEADAAFRLAVDNNLVFYLLRAGRTEEALRRLPALQELADAEGGDVDRLRVRWVAARVMAEREDDPDAAPRAETIYREVLDGFCERKLAYDAALTAMDLARLLMRQDLPGEVKELALSVQPIFEALGVDVEVHRAVRTYLAAHRRDEHAALGVTLLTGVWWRRRPR